jgi:hypothetical protein
MRMCVGESEWGEEREDDRERNSKGEWVGVSCESTCTCVQKFHVSGIDVCIHVRI